MAVARAAVLFLVAGIVFVVAGVLLRQAPAPTSPAGKTVPALSAPRPQGTAVAPTLPAPAPPVTDSQVKEARSATTEKDAPSPRPALSPVQEETGCPAGETVPLTSLGIPFPTAPGEGIDLATLRDACRSDAATALSVRLGGGMPGEGAAATQEKGAKEWQRLRASIGGYQGRLSQKDFVVNFGATFE